MQFALQQRHQHPRILLCTPDRIGVRAESGLDNSPREDVHQVCRFILADGGPKFSEGGPRGDIFQVYVDPDDGAEAGPPAHDPFRDADEVAADKFSNVCKFKQLLFTFLSLPKKK